VNGQDLKNSILQLAIQGKLVEQREAEGTAIELLEQIKEEKEKLIKEKKVKKQKELPEITEDETPFDIPKSWEWVRHNELFEIIGGSQPPKSFFKEVEKEGYIRLYQIRDYGDKPAPVYVPKNKVSKFTKKGDILLARYGASVGKVFIAEDGAYNVALAKSTHLFSSELIDTNYMYFYYLAPLYQKLVRRNSRSAQAGFNKDDLDSLLIPLPPLGEQKRIVAMVEELMPYVDKYDKSYSEVEELNKKFPEDMQKSILQYAIKGKLIEQQEEEGTAEELYQQIQVEKKKLIKEGKIKKTKALPEITEDEKPFDIPESWKWVRLGELALYLDAGKSPNCVKQSVVSDEWGVITTTSIQCNFFDQSQNKILPSSFEVKEDMQVKTGDVLITRAGPTNRTGVACFVHDITFNLILSDKTVRVNLSDEYLDKRFITQAINSPSIRNYIIHMMSGMDKQQVNISQDKIRNIIIPLPPLKEQKRIVEKIEELLPYTKQLVK
jgi:type I restriction enzyme, S subunit